MSKENYNLKKSECNYKFINSLYDKDKNIINFKVESEYGSSHSLWYPCETINEYKIINYDLKECIFWKLTFYPDNGQIISMRGIKNECIIQ